MDRLGERSKAGKVTPEGASKRVVALEVCGKSYQVSTSETAEDMRALAGVVEERTRDVLKGRAPKGDVLLLTALALAHDARAAREEHGAWRERVRGEMQGLVGAIDAALGELEDGDAEASGNGEE